MAARRPKNAALLKMEPTEQHTTLADFITSTTGQEVSAETVGLVQRAYPLYLKSPVVQKARAAEKARREKEAAAKAAEKRQKLQARLDRIEEQRKKLLSDLGIEEGAEVIEAEDRFRQPDPETEAADMAYDDGEEQTDEVDLTSEDDEELFTDDSDDDEEDW